jgi:hypothetical protein
MVPAPVLIAKSRPAVRRHEVLEIGAVEEDGKEEEEEELQ